ncbi:TetR/AcrR family transcriptional regulator [Nocardia mexicana]|nr:TetR family transcriptional regulator [Nocardia mexicana]
MSSMDQPGPEAGPNRQGRWRTGQESKRKILEAARASFAAHGYQGTTVRSIAAAAEVDPSMIHYFFGRKDQLFAATMNLPDGPREPMSNLLTAGLDGLGARLVRRFLEVWDAAERMEPLLIMARSTGNSDASADMLREYIDQEFTAQLVAAVDRPDAALRCDLVCAQLLGIATARYSIRQEPLASADHDTLVAWLGPILQRLLTDPSPPVAPTSGSAR